MSNPSHTPTYKLFHYPFKCRVAAMHVYTEEYLSVRGHITTGDSEKDRNMMESKLEVSLTIKQLADYYGEGVNVELINPVDSVRIYEIINDFLTGYRQALDNSFNFQVDDMDFIKNVDSLASAVYGVAKPHIKDNLAGSAILGQLERFGSRNPFSRGVTRTVKMEKEHRPISDSISEKALRSKRRWQ